jgi:hypothetical protein
MAMLDRGLRTGEDDFKQMTRRRVMGYGVPSLYVWRETTMMYCIYV